MNDALPALDHLREARAALLAEIDQDYAQMKAITARVEARETLLRHLEIAVEIGEAAGLGGAPLRERRKPGRPKGWKKHPAPILDDEARDATGAMRADSLEGIPAAFREEVAEVLRRT
jgi:hypothetical protein